MTPLIIAGALLAVHILITVIAPRILANPRLVMAFPGRVLHAWLASLIVAASALTLSLGILIATALWHQSAIVVAVSSKTPTPNEWVLPVVETLLGWLAVAALGVLAFRLGAEATTLRSKNRQSVQQIMPLLAQAVPLDLSQPTSHIFTALKGGNKTKVIVTPSEESLVVSMPQARLILLSSHTASRLNKDELGATLVHEQKHIYSRHDVLLTLASLALAVAGGLSASKRFSQSVRICTELVADDEAKRIYDARTVAQALRTAYASDNELAERITRLTPDR